MALSLPYQLSFLGWIIAVVVAYVAVGVLVKNEEKRARYRQWASSFLLIWFVLGLLLPAKETIGPELGFPQRETPAY